MSSPHPPPPPHTGLPTLIRNLRPPFPTLKPASSSLQPISTFEYTLVPHPASIPSIGKSTLAPIQIPRSEGGESAGSAVSLKLPTLDTGAALPAPNQLGGVPASPVMVRLSPVGIDVGALDGGVCYPGGNCPTMTSPIVSAPTRRRSHSSQSSAELGSYGSPVPTLNSISPPPLAFTSTPSKGLAGPVPIPSTSAPTNSAVQDAVPSASRSGSTPIEIGREGAPIPPISLPPAALSSNYLGSTSPQPAPTQIDTSLLPATSPPTYVGAVEDASIDDLLLKSGYSRLETLTRQDPDGERVIYIKVMSPWGDLALLDADRAGVVSVQPRSRLLVEATPASIIPAGVRRNMLNQVGTGVTGVVLECDGEFCVLKRQDDTQIGEATYRVASSVPQNRGAANGTVSYPVISMAEMELDSIGTHQRIHLAASRLHTGINAAASSCLATLIQETESLTSELRTLEAAHQRMHEFRAAELNQVLLTMEATRGLPEPWSAETRDSYNQLLAQAHKLSQVRTRLMTIAATYPILLSTIQKQRVHVKDSIYAMYMEVRRSYSEPISTALRDATVWDLPAELNAVGDTLVTDGAWPSWIPETTNVAALRRVLGKPKGL